MDRVEGCEFIQLEKKTVKIEDINISYTVG